MLEPSPCDAELIQYLNEAYGDEMGQEIALQAHIAIATQGLYEGRLRQHLQETRAHALKVAKRITQLGGKVDAGPLAGFASTAVASSATTGQEAAARAAAATKGPLEAIGHSGEIRRTLDDVKTVHYYEIEEIATYTAIETLAEAVNDHETAELARTIRRDEERMAKFLEEQIVVLNRARSHGKD